MFRHVLRRFNDAGEAVSFSQTAPAGDRELPGTREDFRGEGRTEVRRRRRGSSTRCTEGQGFPQVKGVRLCYTALGRAAKSVYGALEGKV